MKRFLFACVAIIAMTETSEACGRLRSRQVKQTQSCPIAQDSIRATQSNQCVGCQSSAVPAQIVQPVRYLQTIGATVTECKNGRCPN